LPNQDDLHISLGNRIRELRKTQELRISDLAQAANLTTSMISQVERGKISPSIETLKMISNVLKVPISYFFETSVLNDDSTGESQNSAFVGNDISPVVHEQQRKILSPGKGVCFYLLNPNMLGPIEFIYNIYEPGCGTGEGLYTHIGHECGLILEGELVVQIEDKKYRLKKGDSITFDSSKPHSKINDGSTPCICVWANTPPYF
jgi:transcriptional regulator with XRE-family HTH domain